MNHFNVQRRALLGGGLAFASGLALQSSAKGAPGSLRRRLEDAESERDARNLVLIQLTGGNDGLSTVVPFADDGYYRDRKTTAVKPEDVLKIDDYRGLHPSLTRLRELYENEKVAIVEGVGYPNPGRSHFQSYEIWHTAHLSGRVVPDGWAGRLCEAAWPEVDNSELIVHVGTGDPFSIQSRRHPPVSIASPTSYQWFGDSRKTQTWRQSGSSSTAAAGEGGPEPQSTGRRAVLSRLRQVLDVADTSSKRVRRAASVYRPKASYPLDGFAANLRDIAAFIHGGLGTRVFSCELVGFDTHAKQRERHDELMMRLDAGLGAFMEDLSKSSLGKNTVVVVISEFGRRVAENESGGHDHGQAGPVLVMGHAVKGGLYGKHPSLTELDQGDLAYTTDFRRIYATIIKDWFGVDSKPLLFGDFDSLRLV